MQSPFFLFYDERVKRFLFIFLFFSFLFFLAPIKQAFAAKTCTITVTDESGDKLDKVQISLIFANSPTQYANATGKPGEYTFSTNTGLGGGSFLINAIRFEKDGYQYKIFDYSGRFTEKNPPDPYAVKQAPNVCPGSPNEKIENGIVQLDEKSTGKSYGCYKGFCSEIDYESPLEPDKIYDDEKSEASCKADCGFYELKEYLCIPNRQNSVTHFTKSSCEADIAKKKLPEGQKEELYTFNPFTKTCTITNIPNDPKGLSKEECNKIAEEIIKKLITPPPLPPPCSKFVILDENGKEIIENGEPKTLTNEELIEKLRNGEFNKPENSGFNFKCAQVKTGILDIDTRPTEFVKKIMGFILGLSGGIAVLLIIVSGYRLMASQGNPEKVQGAKESLTSAIVGLLFIIFALVILQVIGVNILKLPGFK